MPADEAIVMTTAPPAENGLFPILISNALVVIAAELSVCAVPPTVTVRCGSASPSTGKLGYPVGLARINQPPFDTWVSTVNDTATDVVAPAAGLPSVTVADCAAARAGANGATRVTPNSATRAGAHSRRIQRCMRRRRLWTEVLFTGYTLQSSRHSIGCCSHLFPVLQGVQG